MPALHRGAGQDPVPADADPLRPAPPSRGNRAALLAFVVANAVGFSGTSAVPMWLGMFSDFEGARSWIASAEILLVGLGSIVGAGLLSRIGAKRLCLWGAILATAANLLSLVPHIAFFVAGRCGAGFLLGGVLASVNAVAAQRDDAQKLFATMFFGQAVFSALLYMLVPAMIDLFGDRAIFIAVAATTAIGAVVIGRCFPESGAAAGGGEPFRPMAAAIVMLLGLGALFVGQSMAWISLFTIGAMAGLEAASIGRVMAFASVGMMAGPLLARITGTRMGLVAPVIGCAFLLMLDVMVIGYLRDIIPFAAAAAGLVFLPAFGLPYAAALVARTGGAKHASAMPATITFGSAIGPALAAPLLQGGGQLFPIVGAAICMIGGMAILIAALAGRAKAEAG